MHVEAVGALAPHQGAVISRHLTYKGTKLMRRKGSTWAEILQGPRGLGYSQSGQQPLKAIRQMPQFSSLATQSQEATPFQLFIFTFILARLCASESSQHLAGEPVAQIEFHF